jgi:hypothetical protein
VKKFHSFFEDEFLYKPKISRDSYIHQNAKEDYAEDYGKEK